MQLICTFINAYIIAIFIRIVLHWFPLHPDGIMATIHGFLHLVTEPVLGPLRRIIPTVPIGNARLDLSPLVVIFGGQILVGALC